MIEVEPTVTIASPPTISIKIRVPENLRGTRKIQVDILKVNALRDEFATAIATSLDLSALRSFTIALPNTLMPGLYKIVSFRVQNSPSNEEEFTELLDRNAPFDGCLHFLLVNRGEAASDPQEAAEAAYVARQSLIADVQITPRAIPFMNTINVAGCVLCHGVVLQQRQDLRGISVIPYGHGLDYTPLRQSADNFAKLAWGFPIFNNDQVAADYATQTQTCAIVMHQLRAVDIEDAFSHLIKTAEDIATLISLDRGYKPVLFAAIIYNGVEYWHRYFYGRYTGNLIFSFDPWQTGATIETYLPKLQSFPRARLLLESYAQATSDRDYAFRHFRYWAVLELIAKTAVATGAHAIVDARGTQICDAQGRPIKTEGAAAKVYQYLFENAAETSVTWDDMGISRSYSIEIRLPKASTSESEVFSLWDVVGAIYEIRNQVAHTGSFVMNNSAQQGSRLSLASRFHKHPSEFLFRFLKDETWLAVRREVAKMSQ